jgi:hypothetical protein
MTLKELGALLRRELAKWLGVGVHGLGVQWRGIVSFLKDGEAPEKTRDGLSAINVNVHVSRSPRARTRSARARIRRARPRQRVLLQSPNSTLLGHSALHSERLFLPHCSH